MSKTKAGQAIFYSLSALLVCASSAQAESSQSLLSRVFQTGDIDALENLAAEKIRENPADSVAHFFMGVAYYKQNRYALAGPEFNEVLKYSKNPEEMRRARQYIVAIAGQNTNAQTKTSATPAASNNANAAGAGGTADKTLQVRIKQLQDQAKSKKSSAAERFDAEVKHIRSLAKNTSKDSAPDPETQRQINDAFARMSKYESEIDKELQQQIADLTNPSNSIRGETRVSSGSNGTIKNYEHLGDDSQAVNLPTENALSAKAQSLKAIKKK